MNKKIIFILLGVVIIAVAAVLVYVFVLSPGDAEPVYTYYSPGEPFIVNVNNDRSILKTTLFLVLDTDSSKLTDQLDVLKPLIRDIISAELRQRTVEQLGDVAHLDTLRQELAQALNEGLSLDGFENPVYSILFTDYFLQ